MRSPPVSGRDRDGPHHAEVLVVQHMAVQDELTGVVELLRDERDGLLGARVR